MTNCVGTPVATGGAISLAITASGTAMTLERAVSGQAFSQIYSGVPTPVYIDCGDGLNTPLASGVVYQYRVTDVNGVFLTSGIEPILSLNIEQEPLNAMLIKLFQGGFNNLAVPAGITPNLQVLQAMPLGGLPPMPFAVVNMDLMQQDQIPIGQDVEQLAADGSWTITGFCKRIFRLSILADNSGDRDFYRDAGIGIFQALMRTVFGPIGLDVEHSYQATSGQVADDNSGNSPGFYYAEVLMTFLGTFNISISPSYGSLSVITFDANLTDGSGTAVSVSVSG